MKFFGNFKLMAVGVSIMLMLAACDSNPLNMSGIPGMPTEFQPIIEETLFAAPEMRSAFKIVKVQKLSENKIKIDGLPETKEMNLNITIEYLVDGDVLLKDLKAKSKTTMSEGDMIEWNRFLGKHGNSFKAGDNAVITGASLAVEKVNGKWQGVLVPMYAVESAKK